MPRGPSRGPHVGRARRERRGAGSDARATASGERASAAQAESAADPNADASGAGDAAATDVEIAAADSGDEGGPAALPFTGLQLVLIGMAGVAALAGGALLRRAA